MRYQVEYDLKVNPNDDQTMRLPREYWNEHPKIAICEYIDLVLVED